MKAIFDSVNVLAVYNTVQYGIDQDHQCHNMYCYFTVYQSFILKYDKDRSIFKFVIVKAAQDDGK